MIRFSYSAVRDIYETVLGEGSFIRTLDGRVVVIPNDTFNPYVWDGKVWYIDRKIKVDVSVI